MNTGSEESHPAIISPEEFELVQAEMAKRKQLDPPKKSL